MKTNYAASAVLAAGVMTLALAVPAFAQTAQAAPSSAARSGWAQNGTRGRSEEARSMAGPGISGTVSAVNGTTITVSGTAFMKKNASSTTAVSYTVDASAAIVKKGTGTSTVSAIAVGDKVFVIGAVNGTSITAKVILDGQMMRGTGNGPASGFQGNGEPVVAGKVSAVNGTVFTLTNNGGIAYSIDASAAVVKKGAATSTVSAIAVGDTVLVQGTVNGTSVSATTVIDQAAKASEPALSPRGFFDSIGSFFKRLFGF